MHFIGLSRLHSEIGARNICSRNISMLWYQASKFVIGTFRLMWEGPQVSADLERGEEIRFIGSIKLLSGVALGCVELSACWSLAWRWERQPSLWLLGWPSNELFRLLNILLRTHLLFRSIELSWSLPVILNTGGNQMSEETATWVRLTFGWSCGTDLMIEAGTSVDNTNKTETCQGECL